MLGKVIGIGKKDVIVELSISDDKVHNIVNYHVAFDMGDTVIIGEVESIDSKKANINLIGEIYDGKFILGISKKPYFNSSCRVITNEELPLIMGTSNDMSVYIGKLMQYNEYKIYANINDLFSNHFAILGNTGSGKSHGVARLIQNIFGSKIPKNANIFLFDAYGEYNQAFEKLEYDGNKCLKVYNTKIEEFESANMELLKIPPWLLDVDDYALLLGVESATQLPIIEKALKLVSIFAKNEEEVIIYKNDIIARALLDILHNGGNPSVIRDQIFAILTSFNTKDLNLESKVTVPGWTRPLKQCLLIDRDGKISDIQLVIEFINTFVKEGLELNLPDGTYPFTLEDLNHAFDFALIGEGIFSSSKVYDENHILKVRLETLINSNYSEYFKLDKYITFNDYIKGLVTDKKGKKVQLINFNISYVDDRFAKVIVKIISKILFYYSLEKDNRASFPVHILLEEAHRYVQNDKDNEILGYNIFERITKEGRKYGVILGLISQRPSEISETSISQCINFLVFRMQHPRDLEYIKQMLPNVTEELINKFNTLQPGNCVAFGHAFRLPLQLKLDMPDPVPLSQNIDISSCWY